MSVFDDFLKEGKKAGSESRKSGSKKSESRKDNSESRKIVEAESESRKTVSQQVASREPVSHQASDREPVHDVAITDKLVRSLFEKIAVLEQELKEKQHDLSGQIERLEVVIHGKEFQVVSEGSDLSLSILFELIRESNDENGKQLKQWCFFQKAGPNRERNENRYKRVVAAVYLFLQERKLLK